MGFHHVTVEAGAKRRICVEFTPIIRPPQTDNATKMGLQVKRRIMDGFNYTNLIHKFEKRFQLVVARAAILCDIRSSYNSVTNLCRFLYEFNCNKTLYRALVAGAIAYYAACD